MTEYCKGKPEDIADIIDFGNYIFSQNSEPHDFKELLPKLYGDRHNSAEHHYLVKEDGKIKAMILAYPSKLKVGDTLLDICGIGTVSVHKYSRGSGYMKQLMKIALEDMKKNGIHFSVLGGQRQRYEYFGYEPCGLQADFMVTKTNVRHGIKNADSNSVSFDAICFEDEAKLKQAYELYQTKSVGGIRPLDQFYDILCTWKNQPYSITLNGDYLGFVTMKSGRIGELVLNDYSQLSTVIAAILSRDKVDSISISSPFYEQASLEFLSSLCESFNVSQNHSFNILNYAVVIKAFMEQKASYSTLAKGELVIKIGEEVLKISVLENKVTVESSDCTPEASFSHLEAMLRLFSPATGFLSNSLTLNSAAKTWFPLPLFLSELDCI